MTPIDRFERQLPTALIDLADERVPDYFVDILGQTARKRQRPAWVFPGRWISMPDIGHRPAMAGLVAIGLVALIAGGIVYLGGTAQRATTPAATPSPAPSGSPTAASSGATALPDPLLATWLAVPKDLAAGGATIQVVFGPGWIGAAWTTDLTSALSGSASASDPNTIEVRAFGSAAGCHLGDVGHYDWSLSPGGTKLTLTPVDDACASRAALLPAGEWLRLKCPIRDNGCYGNLEAGTYRSQFILPRRDASSGVSPDYGTLTVTVPDGWSNIQDAADVFALTPTAGQDDAATRVVTTVMARPAANAIRADCASTEDLSVGTTVDKLAAYVHGLPALTTTAPHDLTIAGRHARWLDVQLAPGWTGTCPELAGTPGAIFLARQGAAYDAWVTGLSGTEKARLVFIDIGGGDTALVVVDAPDPAKFDAGTAAAMPVIQSLTFR